MVTLGGLLAAFFLEAQTFTLLLSVCEPACRGLVGNLLSFGKWVTYGQQSCVCSLPVLWKLLGYSQWKLVEGVQVMGRKARILVVGCGTFGSAVAQSLSAGGNEVIAVDMREEAFDQLGDDFDGETLTGDGSCASVLQECEVERVTHLVAATGHDATNMLIAELASEVFGVRHVLPVIDDDSLVEILENRGIASICPHRICEEEFFRLSKLPREEGGLS